MTLVPTALLLLVLAAAPAAPAAASVPGTVDTPASARPAFPYPGDASRAKGPATLRLVEVGRKRTPGTVEVDYRLEGGGFPAGKVYELWQYALGGEPEKLCGALKADAGGSLVPDDSAAVHEASLCGTFGDIIVGAYQYMPGEPYRVAIVSSDSTVLAVATAFPHPIEATDGPYRLLLEMTSADRRSFVLWGVGFDKDQTLTTVLTSNSESFQGGAFADEHGVLRLHLDAPPDAPGGVASYEVRGKSGAPKVSYRWGNSRASTDGARAPAPAPAATPGK